MVRELGARPSRLDDPVVGLWAPELVSLLEMTSTLQGCKGPKRFSPWCLVQRSGYKSLLCDRDKH